MKVNWNSFLRLHSRLTSSTATSHIFVQFFSCSWYTSCTCSLYYMWSAPNHYINKTHHIWCWISLEIIVFELGQLSRELNLEFIPLAINFDDWEINWCRICFSFINFTKHNRPKGLKNVFLLKLDMKRKRFRPEEDW